MSAHSFETRIRPGIDATRAAHFLTQTRSDFIACNPRSAQLSQAAQTNLLFGVPLHWMQDWGTPFALHVAQANGAEVIDVDGHTLVDFCLGDTGAMFGHAPAPLAQTIATEASKGFTTMLASEPAAAVGQLLAARFGLPVWQFALSATDANRYLLRWIRAATGRSKIVVFNGCYHGTIEDACVDLVNGRTWPRASLLGQVHDLTASTVVIEFNDLQALEQALQAGDVACVLAEPVMTNIGMVLPQEGYWQAAQELIRRYGVLLVMDETHTISSGISGYARANGIEADALVVGKPIAGGLACAVYGMSAALAQQAQAAKLRAPTGHSGIGTTLTGNRLTLYAVHTMLTQVMTQAAYDSMLARANQLAAGLRALFDRYQLPWCVTQVGARIEFQFCAIAPCNGSQADAGLDPWLEQLIHLGLLNQGIMITPFHNMLLVCPHTSAAHVAQLLSALAQILAAITCDR